MLFNKETSKKFSKICVYEKKLCETLKKMSIAKRYCSIKSCENFLGIVCISTFTICKTASTFFKIFEKNHSYSYDGLVNTVLHQVDLSSMYPKTNFDGHEHHKYDFVNFIAEEFIRIHATTLAKKITLDQQKMMLRSKLKKMVSFLGL